MEVQLTDFENAAFAVFVILISRAILSFNLNFYIPISKVSRMIFAMSCIEYVLLCTG
jgi:glutamate--cysteine ligase catalytic subunit